jgi:undecaprenyl-diphosphatase
VESLNLALLQWMAAGDEPTGWILLAGCVLARCGATLAALVTAWAFWRRPGERGHVVAAWIAAGVASTLSHAIASRLGVQRPFALGLTPAYIWHGASAAMPSTHACVMATVAFLFLRNAALRDAGAVLLALAALTGWARIYVGVHFPFDVLAGFLLAMVLAGLFAAVHHAVVGPDDPGPFAPSTPTLSGDRWKRS